MCVNPSTLSLVSDACTAGIKAQLSASRLPDTLKANKLGSGLGSRWRKDLRERWDGSLLVFTVDDSLQATDALSWHLQTLQLQRLQTLLRYNNTSVFACLPYHVFTVDHLQQEADHLGWH